MVINFVKSQKLTEDEINELKSILDNSQNTAKK